VYVCIFFIFLDQTWKTSLGITGVSYSVRIIPLLAIVSSLWTKKVDDSAQGLKSCEAALRNQSDQLGLSAA